MIDDDSGVTYKLAVNNTFDIYCLIEHRALQELIYFEAVISIQCKITFEQVDTVMLRKMRAHKKAHPDLLWIIC